MFRNAFMIVMGISAALFLCMGGCLLLTMGTFSSVGGYVESKIEKFEKLDSRRAMLLDAIWAVETGRAESGAAPIGAAGEIGPYQITEAYWKDANMRHGEYSECEDKKYSEQVIHRYMDRYCDVAWTLIRDDKDMELIARTHNGGPQGPRKQSTLVYWQKVKKVLDETKGQLQKDL